MADATTVQNLVEYYSNLLIIQYHNKPNAKATIELMVNELMADGVELDVLNGYDINTAVGAQLDVLGKYIGVSRVFQDNNLTQMFSLTNYIESDPSAQDRWGFDTYSTFDSTVENGTLTYDSVISANFFLNDDAYRQLLKLKIIKNYSNGSHASIDNAIFEFFGTDVTVSQTANMEMTYTIPFTFNYLIEAAIIKGILPKPIGVNLVVAIS